MKTRPGRRVREEKGGPRLLATAKGGLNELRPLAIQSLEGGGSVASQSAEFWRLLRESANYSASRSALSRLAVHV